MDTHLRAQGAALLLSLSAIQDQRRLSALVSPRAPRPCRPTSNSNSSILSCVDPRPAQDLRLIPLSCLVEGEAARFRARRISRLRARRASRLRAHRASRLRDRRASRLRDRRAGQDLAAPRRRRAMVPHLAKDTLVLVLVSRGLVLQVNRVRTLQAHTLLRDLAVWGLRLRGNLHGDSSRLNPQSLRLLT